MWDKRNDSTMSKLRVWPFWIFSSSLLTGELRRDVLLLEIVCVTWQPQQTAHIAHSLKHPGTFVLLCKTQVTFGCLLKVTALIQEKIAENLAFSASQNMSQLMRVICAKTRPESSWGVAVYLAVDHSDIPEKKFVWCLREHFNKCSFLFEPASDPVWLTSTFRDQFSPWRMCLQTVGECSASIVLSWHLSLRKQKPSQKCGKAHVRRSEGMTRLGRSSCVVLLVSLPPLYVRHNCGARRPRRGSNFRSQEI